MVFCSGVNKSPIGILNALANVIEVIIEGGENFETKDILKS